MKLDIEYNNGKKFSADIEESTPMELAISIGGNLSRQKAIEGYIQAIKYTLQGVSNIATKEIESIEISANWFGDIKKYMDSIKYNTIIDKCYVNIYTIANGSIKEDMYVADELKLKGKNIVPIWLSDVLCPNDDKVKERVMDAIIYMSKYNDDYLYAKKGDSLIIIDKEGEPIQIDDIEDNEAFTIAKYLQLLMAKGDHMGVVFIDGSNLSDKAIMCIDEISRAMLLSTLVFVYNCRKASKVKRGVMHLPNFNHFKQY